MKPYPAYKDSGVEWLGDIPEHWTTKRLQYVSRLNPETLPESTDPYMSFDYVDIGSLGTGVMTRKPERMTFAVSPSRARRVVREGDTVLSTVRTYLKAAYHFRKLTYPTIASTGFLVIRPNGKALNGYLSRAIITEGFVDEVVSRSVGVSYPAITESKLAKIRIPIPPLDEQRAIADFLDGMDARITRFIASRRKMIALLEEKKQAVINQAVTRGLDPSVPMKNSGVDWLGEIPAHWEVRRIKTAVRETDTRSQTGEEELLSLRMREGLVPHTSVSERPIEKNALIGYKNVQPGQLVMNRMRASIGVFGVTTSDGLVSPDYAIFDIHADTNANFLLRLLKTPMMGDAFRLQSSGLGTGHSGFLRLYTDDFGRVKIPFPSYEEQQEIVDHIDREASRIDSLITRHRREIDLMQEYRTRLINDVVTGKLDVRGVELPAVEQVIGEEIEAAMDDEVEEEETVWSN